MPKVVVDKNTKDALTRIKKCTEASLETLRLSFWNRHYASGVKAEGEQDDIYSQMNKAESDLMGIIESCRLVINPEEWVIFDSTKSTAIPLFTGSKRECEEYMKSCGNPYHYTFKKEG